VNGPLTRDLPMAAALNTERAGRAFAGSAGTSSCQVPVSRSCRQTSCKQIHVDLSEDRFLKN